MLTTSSYALVYLLFCGIMSPALIKVSAQDSSWLYVPPNPLTYCPSSPLTYDCQKYQDDVWNVPSLASSPSSRRNGTALGNFSLLLFLAGTGSTPHDFRHGLLEAWRAYDRAHILGQSYVSTPYPVSDMNMLCGDGNANGGESVADCLHHFHDNVVFGEKNISNSSPLWSGLKVSDAIEQRVVFSLQTLHARFPQQGWNQFYTQCNEGFWHIVWDRVIVSGHSQGGGHAAFIGYTRSTSQVVLLSSPQDCCSFATFVDQPWQTPESKVSALYHFYEDARGIISRSIDSIAPSYPSIEFTVPFSPSSSSSRVFFSKYSPQPSCSCTSRSHHCSTALDSCAPLLNMSVPSTALNLHAYYGLWQFLAFGGCLSC